MDLRENKVGKNDIFRTIIKFIFKNDNFSKYKDSEEQNHHCFGSKQKGRSKIIDSNIKIKKLGDSTPIADKKYNDPKQKSPKRIKAKYTEECRNSLWL